MLSESDSFSDHEHEHGWQWLFLCMWCVRMCIVLYTALFLCCSVSSSDVMLQDSVLPWESLATVFYFLVFDLWLNVLVLVPCAGSGAERI